MDYTIKTDRENILGSGSFCVVYKAKKTGEEREIAAKSINAAMHPQIPTQDLERLMNLDHKDVVEIFDFHQENETFWIFMELCPWGDLNQVFQKQKVDFQQRSEIMIRISKGVAYLHDNNIIHRDIKPENILIKSIDPVMGPKLTDFDLSKFLDEDAETSVMGTNVGTNAFRAPEFFNRIGGRLRYHRNVDIYACAMTFLAMIQATEGVRRLAPHIETPFDDLELYVLSIGQLIAERVRYNIPELNIVRISEMVSEGGGASSDRGQNIRSIRGLIQKMTCVEPGERLTAFQVVKYLEQVNIID